MTNLRAALTQQEPVAVHQFRKQYCANWYDGHPDHTDGGGPYEERTLYTALRAALAQQAEPKGGGNLPPPLQAEPVQEPVSGVVLNDEGRAALVEHGAEDWHCALRNARRLYTAPPQRNPLTEEEIQELSQQHKFGSRMEKFVRVIERAHGIGEQS